jgi:hypothetical protein
MNIEEGIELALSGKSILFLGAGFSKDAQNLRGGSFKVGGELAEYLATLAGIEEKQLNKITLDDAAEEYINVHGKDKLIDELHNEFTAKIITASQSQIASIPWRRIYTTNYDDIFEKAYAENGKKLVPVTTGDDIRNIPSGNTLCVHLNGYIDRLDRNTLMSEFKLTETSYLTSSVENSPWATLFRDDIKSARSIFFVGYSLADLDIKRILYEYESLKDKCFFVLGGSPTRTTINSCSKFGQILGLETSTFAAEAKKIITSYVPNEAIGFSSSYIEKYAIPDKNIFYSDDDLFALFLQGNINSSFLAKSFSGEIRYFLERHQIKDTIELIQHKPTAIVFHSELGNGKTLLVEGVKFRASQAGFSVYTLLDNSDSLLEDIDKIFVDQNKKIIVIENYTDWMNQIRSILSIADDKCSFVLTSRTSAHDIHIEELSDIFADLEVKEIPVDKLTSGDISWIAKTLDEYGLWGKDKSKSLEKKLEILSSDCDSEFQGVLLELLKSPDIISRFRKIIDNIEHKKGYYLVVVTILMLNVLNKPISIDRLIDYWGTQILDSKFKQDPLIREIIDFQKNSVVLRSSVIAKYILHTHVDITTAVDVLIKLVRTSNNLSRVTQYHFEVKNLLLRFNSLQELLPEKGNKQVEIIRYYESIKNLSTVNNYPLFWLQYAIACEVLEEFDRTEKYFETAYSLAYDRHNFDTYQIDNRFAEFLLNRAIKQKRDVGKAMSDFIEAHKIISAQAKNERLDFPFKVAILYDSFYDEYSDDLQTKHKDLIKQAASEIITRIHALPRARQAWLIRRCETVLTSLLEKVSGIKY